MSNKSIEYGASEGIKIDQFLYGSGYISSDNTLYFGGTGGFYAFNSAQILQKENLSIPKILLTEAIVNKPSINEEGESINKSIQAATHLNLAHDEHTFTIGFTVIDYLNPEKVYLEYQLEGEDRIWRKAGNNKTAQYYNLPPGDYLFKVRGANSRGLWNKEIKSLKICIFPPWYQTWWAYLLFFSGISGLIYWVYQFQLNRQLAVRESKRLAELDLAKTRLYTNITHEFRTPLTVILGMTNRLADKLKAKKINEQETVDLIQRNSRQLLGLINQMLDLAKLESNTMSLQMQQSDIIAYLKYLFQSFESMAETKNIRMHFVQEIDACLMDFDSEKIRMIIANLLSNAIKFTPVDGLITLTLNQTNATIFGIFQKRKKIVDN